DGGAGRTAGALDQLPARRGHRGDRRSLGARGAVPQVSASAPEPPRLDLSFVRRGGRTVIDRRLFAWPFVLTRSFHTDGARPDLLSVILQTGSGAVHGEDRLTQRFTLREGAA